MSLLKELIKEEAAAGATAAHAIAGTGGHEGVADLKKDKKKKRKMRRRMFSAVVSEADAGMDGFDPADVVSKMKSAQKANNVDGDTVAFALEDENGDMVKVFVRADQADDFEEALQAALAPDDGEDEDLSASSKEIAEVLFDLRNTFDIVDIDFPSIPEDEEEVQEVEGDGGSDAEMDGEEGMGDDEGLGDDEMVADDGAGEEAAASALTQVIDMMKADAEARTAEANAKKADAEASIARHAASAADAKIKQEEEILDMEAFNKKKGDEGKEAKRLAQLAKYKHDMDGGAEEVETAMPEEEEVSGDTISTEDLAALLINRLRAN